MPRGAQLAALEQLSGDLGPWIVLGRAARHCGVECVRVSGAYGFIQGAPNDSVILAEYARRGHWAERTNQLLLDFFNTRGGQYVDVGANIGLTTVPVAQNATVQCLAIEPDPTNFSHLKENVSRNCRHGNVELCQVAAFSEWAELPLEIAPDNLGDHRLRTREISEHTREGRWATVLVRAAPLDQIVPDTSGHLAVKIDTQGAEPFVFAGGQRTLSKASLLISEWAPYWLARLGGNPEVVTSFLRANFATVAVAEGETGEIPKPEPVSIAAERLLEFASQFKHDRSKYVDIIAAR
jgi:FkbM family methyltransferase